MTTDSLETLIQYLSKLPGLGPRSARRAALHLLKNKQEIMEPLVDSLQTTATQIVTCGACGNLDVTNPCGICQDNSRDQATLCVVEEVADLWAIERTHTYQGQYHVLGGTLSALDGIGPDDLNFGSLFDRTKPENNVREIILATNATVDGQTTAHYLTEKLKHTDLTITRLAHGVPMGGELDYLDDGTLTAALSSRRPF